MRIMKFERWSKYLSLRESVKDDELNRILDKISSFKSQNFTVLEFLKCVNIKFGLF